MWGMLQQMGLTSTATGDDTPLSAQFLTATPGQFYTDIFKSVFFKREASLLSHRSWSFQKTTSDTKVIYRRMT
jgi:hypothetical protein